jgi:hypothetical protein
LQPPFAHEYTLTETGQLVPQPKQCPLAHVWALAHALPQPPQLPTSDCSSTQVLPQRVGAASGQPEAHPYVPPEPAQTGAAPLHALPQLPQLSALVSWTQAPPQSVYPVTQANPHSPLAHAGWALATVVEQTLPQVSQSFTLLVASTQVPPQSVDAVGGQLAAQAYETPSALAHTGVAPVHALPQLPQSVAVVNGTHAAPQRLKPLLQENAHAPAVHADWALGTAVLQTLPQLPQLRGLDGSTQLPAHAMRPLEHEGASSSSAASEPASSACVASGWETSVWVA